MKIGILTYHYVYNEGAIWQAYSLCNYLRARWPEHRTEIIDYRHKSKYESIISMRSPELLDVYDRVLADFLSDNAMVDNGSASVFSWITRHYDLVIVGSDIIWQYERRPTVFSRVTRAFTQLCAMEPSRVSAYDYARDVKNLGLRILKREFCGDPRQIAFPNAYWLHPDLDVIKTTFAASVGYSDIQAIPDRMMNTMVTYISALNYISVRDLPTRDFVESLSLTDGKKAEVTPDPTWLFDDTLENVDHVFAGHGIQTGTKLAGVLFPLKTEHGDKLNAWVVPYLRSKGYAVVSVIDPNPNVDFDMAAGVLRPFEWWTVIERLDFFVSVRTHPNIAAIKYETPFANIDITAIRKNARHSKTRDMLDVFGLGDCCIFRQDEFNCPGIEALLESCINRNWNWSRIGAQRDTNRSRCVEVAENIIRFSDAGQSGTDKS